MRTLSETGDLPKELRSVLFGDAAVALSHSKGEVAESLKELFSSLEMNSPEDLKAFLQSQQQSQIKFSGSLFNNLRGMMKEDISPALRDAIFRFAKSYNDFSSSPHFLEQLKTVA